MEIRPIQRKDNQKIYEIIQSILEKYALDVPGTAYYDPQLDHLFEYYQELPRGAYWVLLENNQVIGGIGIGPYGDYEEIAELQKFYILEDYQGKGYGSLLYKQAESYAKAKGYKKLYIETIDVLDQANQAYKHFGYELLNKPLDGSEHELMNRWFIKEI